MKRKREDLDDLSENDSELDFDDDIVEQVDIEKKRLSEARLRFNEAQAKRFEVANSVSFLHNKRGKNERFEKLVRGIIGSTVNDSIMMAVAAASKIYVAELVETGLRVASELRDEGPLQPMHLQEARRRLRRATKKWIL